MSALSSEHLAERIYWAQYGVQHEIPGPFGPRRITYADYIASGQPLDFVEHYLHRQVMPTYANTHTEASFTGRQTGRFREEARALIKQSVGAGEDDALIFCGSGCTAAVDKMVRQFENPAQTVVFVGPFEHHSNVLPWREGGFNVVTVPVDADGLVDIEILEKELVSHQGSTMIGTFAAASNVTGILSPVDQITTLLHKHGALAFWDYAAGAPYLRMNMNPGGLANQDAIFLSPHKGMGGPGTPGILIAKRALLQRPVPTVPGGGTVQFVTKTTHRYVTDVEMREEGGTPAILESIRAGLVFQLKDMVGAQYIQAKEHEYIERAIAEFRKHPDISILGNTRVPRLGFMSFLIRHDTRYLHHNFVVALLNDLFGIQARGGCNCAGPYGHDLLDIDEATSLAYTNELEEGNEGTKPGWVRLNFNYFIPESEFQFLVDAVIWIAHHGWKLLKTYEFDDRAALWQVGGAAPALQSLREFEKFVSEGEATSTPDNGSRQDRAAAQVRYLQEADDIVSRANDLWARTPNQQYHYEQATNPLRWYTIADDL